jgi:DNA-binding transcriptional MerR regulator
LAKRAGVSVRTVRFYINEGLLPPPPSRGRYTVYSEKYLDWLELIRRLKDAYLPLKEIRDKVSSLTWEEVKALLAQSDRQSAHSQSLEPAKKAKEDGSSAQEYVARLLQEPPDVRALKSAPVPKPETFFQSPPSQSPVQEFWEHITLAPGVELHIRRPVDIATRRKVESLIDLARKLFGS